MKCFAHLIDIYPQFFPTHYMPLPPPTGFGTQWTTDVNFADVLESLRQITRDLALPSRVLRGEETE